LFVLAAPHCDFYKKVTVHRISTLTHSLTDPGINVDGDCAGAVKPRQRDRLPEELDEVVAQLNNLGGLEPASQLVAVGGGAVSKDLVEQRPLIMEDDDDDVAPAADGTLLASTPARPL